MPAIALLVKESLSWLIKVVTTPRNIEYDEIICGNRTYSAKREVVSLTETIVLNPVLVYSTTCLICILNFNTNTKK